MNIYLVKRTDEVMRSEFSSFLVVAESAEQAKTIHPHYHWSSSSEKTGDDFTVVKWDAEMAGHWQRETNRCSSEWTLDMDSINPIYLGPAAIKFTCPVILACSYEDF